MQTYYVAVIKSRHGKHFHAHSSDPVKDYETAISQVRGTLTGRGHRVQELVVRAIDSKEAKILKRIKLSRENLASSIGALAQLRESREPAVIRASRKAKVVRKLRRRVKSKKV